MFQRRQQPQSTARPRRGVITIVVVVSLVVVLAALALVLDRLWVDGARVELTNAAEAAALAAGQKLADDTLLLSETDSVARMNAAREAAIAVARQNVAAGQPVLLNGDPHGDVRFGRITRDLTAGLDRFLETDQQPLSVAVFAQRTRARNNPVSLFLGEVTKLRATDTVAVAEATLDNRVVGVCPLPGSNIPALPLTILYSDDSGVRTDTWYAQLTSATRVDRFRYDEAEQRIVESPDGIPEILLYTNAPAESTDESAGSEDTTDASETEDDAQPNDGGNVCLVDLGTGFSAQGLMRQIQTGIDAEDLASQGGTLLFDQGPVVSSGNTAFTREVCAALAETIGQCRLCLLYLESTADVDGVNVATSQARSLSCLGVAAGRIMSIRPLPNNHCEIIYQPGVLATRTAVLADERPASGRDPLPPNPYVYKLRLTH